MTKKSRLIKTTKSSFIILSWNIGVCCNKQHYSSYLLRTILKALCLTSLWHTEGIHGEETKIVVMNLVVASHLWLVFWLREGNGQTRQPPRHHLWPAAYKRNTTIKPHCTTQTTQTWHALTHLFPFQVSDFIEAVELLQAEVLVLLFRVFVQCLKDTHHLPLSCRIISYKEMKISMTSRSVHYVILVDSAAWTARNHETLFL